ncbi:MAG TPA: hypothetical protein VNT30_00135 [Stellaceae bacterium]|nr:hypothetical protein [Stellaceae bacterium]
MVIIGFWQVFLILLTAVLVVVGVVGSVRTARRKAGQAKPDQPVRREP